MNLKKCAQAATALLLASAAPVFAQQVSCGGIGSQGLWMGGVPDLSNVSNAAAPLLIPGQAAPPGGYAVGLFSVTAPMEVRVEAAPTGGQGDTVLELYDAVGGLLVTDDDSGGSFASRAELMLPAGSYCLAARGFGGGPVTADLQVSRLDQPALTEGLSGGFAGTDPSLPMFVGVEPCMPSTFAYTLGAGPIDGELGQGVAATNTITGAPYYRFTLASPQSLTIRAENEVADPYIYIFDGFGNLIEENDDYDSLNSRIDFTSPLQPGDYCIGMRALSDPDVPVTVSVSAFDAAAAASEEYASGFVAPPADGSAYPVAQIGFLPNVSIRDVQVSGGQAVWFNMEVDDWGLLLISADEVRDSDPVIAVFDEFGNLVAENDDANNSLNSEVAVRVQPGSYMLSVMQYSPGYQGVIRVTMQRFVPAP